MKEVVKLDLTESGISAPAMMKQSAGLPALSDVPCIAAEIEYGNIRVRIFNGVDGVVIQNTFQCIGGMSHAW